MKAVVIKEREGKFYVPVVAEKGCKGCAFNVMEICDPYDTIFHEDCAHDFVKFKETDDKGISRRDNYIYKRLSLLDDYQVHEDFLVDIYPRIKLLNNGGCYSDDSLAVDALDLENFTDGDLPPVNELYYVIGICGDESDTNILGIRGMDGKEYMIDADNDNNKYFEYK